METAAGKIIEDRVGELLAVLDEDVRHLECCLSRLDELRGLVVKRDEAALRRLLDSLGGESAEYAAHEMKRGRLREEFAAVLKCGRADVTLSRLAGVLAGDKAAELSRRRSRLKLLAEQLKKEHASTAMVLTDCARFNGLLLRSMLDYCRTGAVTYSSDGMTRRGPETAFVNLQF